MAELEETKVTGVFGGVQFEDGINENASFKEFDLQGEEQQNAGTIRNNNLPVKYGFWQKFKTFWLEEIDWNREIKVVLTPKQQKVEDEINAFLHQEITWKKIKNFLCKDITFGKNKQNT